MSPGALRGTARTVQALIYTLGTRGDVQPYVALGEALQARGHNVTLVTGRGFDAMIEERGLRAASLNVDFREILEMAETIGALTNPLAMVGMLKQYWSLMTTIPAEMWAIARDAAPDLIVFHPKAAVAQTIAQKLGVPAIASALQPLSVTPTSAFPSLPATGDLGGAGNKLSHNVMNGLTTLAQNRATAGLRRKVLNVTAPRGYGGWSPYGPAPRLIGFSRHLIAKPAEWDENQHVTGYWFLDAKAWSPPPALERFIAAGPPPVYVGFGSMPTAKPLERTRTVIEALRRAGQRGVLATGWGGMAATETADAIFMLDDAPHDWLFPRCAAVVHHGGAGSTHEGLRWGRPSVVCPQAVDQPLWGRLVAGCGAGPKPVPYRSFTSARLAEAITAALAPEIAARAAAIGEAIRAEGGAKRAAAFVEGTLAPFMEASSPTKRCEFATGRTLGSGM